MDSSEDKNKNNQSPLYEYVTNLDEIKETMFTTNQTLSILSDSIKQMLVPYDELLETINSLTSPIVDELVVKLSSNIPKMLAEALEPFQKNLVILKNFDVDITSVKSSSTNYKQISNQEYGGNIQNITRMSKTSAIETKVSITLSGKSYGETELVQLLKENQELRERDLKKDFMIDNLLQSISKGELQFPEEAIILLEENKSSLFKVQSIRIVNAKIIFSKFSDSLDFRIGSLEHNLISAIQDLNLNQDNTVLLDSIRRHSGDYNNNESLSSLKKKYYDAAKRINSKFKQKFKIDYDFIEKSGATFWFNPKYFQ